MGVEKRPAAERHRAVVLPCGVVRQPRRQRVGQRARYLQSACCHTDNPCLKRLGVISGELLKSSAKLESPMERIAEHYIDTSISLAGVILNPSLPLAA